MSMRRDRTVILGAGLCGLSAAYHLEEKAETDHLVLEQAHEAGGLARTETYDGFSFDHSIHILYSRDPYAIDLICGKLLQGDLVRQMRRSFCYTAGVYTEYPYQMNNYGLPPAIIADNIMGLIEARQASSRNGPPRQFEAWIYETYGCGKIFRLLSGSQLPQYDPRPSSRWCEIVSDGVVSGSPRRAVRFLYPRRSGAGQRSDVGGNIR